MARNANFTVGSPASFSRGFPRLPNSSLVAKAEAYNPLGVEVCISITNPGEAEVALSPAFKAILRLAFSDRREPSTDTSRVLFAPEHAAEIVRFLETCGEVDRIVVHCSLGVSRSPAVALGVCDLKEWPPRDLQRQYPVWNAWVRAELVRVGRDILAGAGGWPPATRVLGHHRLQAHTLLRGDSGKIRVDLAGNGRWLSTLPINRAASR